MCLQFASKNNVKADTDSEVTDSESGNEQSDTKYNCS